MSPAKFFSIIFLLLFSMHLKAQKTDTLVLLNGNIITGEIKKLDYGRMLYKTSGMGSVNVKRENIKAFKSNKKFEVLLNNGDVYFGSFGMVDNKSRTVKLNFINGFDTIAINSIVEIYPIKNRFWKRISGNADVGFSYTKGSKIGSFSFSGNVNHRERKFENNLKWNNIDTYSGDSLSSVKSDLTLYSMKRINKGWSVGGFMGYNINSELGLDLRLMISTVVNYDLIYTQRHRFYFSVGPVGNMEWNKEKSNPDKNLEAIVSAAYRYYKYSSPELQITSLLATFTGLTPGKRWRFNYTLDANIEIVNNFYLGVRFYLDFDDSVKGEDVSKTDWGSTMTVGYSFN